MCSHWLGMVATPRQYITNPASDTQIYNLNSMESTTLTGHLVAMCGTAYIANTVHSSIIHLKLESLSAHCWEPLT